MNQNIYLKLISFTLLPILLIGCRVGKIAPLPISPSPTEAINDQTGTPYPHLTLTFTKTATPAVPTKTIPTPHLGKTITQTTSFLTLANTLTPTVTPLSPTASPFPTQTPEQTFPGLIAITDYEASYAGIDVYTNSGVRRLTKDFAVYEEVSWSSDGHWIAFTSNLEGGFNSSEIYKLNLNSGKIVRLTFDNNFLKAWPAFSPDGQTILFSAMDTRDSESHYDLYTMSANGGNWRRLTNTPLSEGDPVWSPDGERIAFIYPDVDPKKTNGSLFNLMVMDKDGTNRRRVMDFLVNGPISWSPDGKRIAFTAFNHCDDIYIVNVDGSGLVQLTDEPVNEQSPTWSPDGQFIAYRAASDICVGNAGQSSIGWDIYIINLMNGQKQKMNVRGNPYDLAWSPVPALHKETTYTITTAGDNLNLRDSHTVTGFILQTLHTGDTVTVLEGPVDSEDYYWWKMRTADGVEGWAVDVLGWYAPVP